MKSDTARTRDCAANSAWSNALLSRSAASRSSATLASNRSSAASACGQVGERAQRIGGAGALSVGDGFDRGVSRGAELVGVRGVTLRQLIPGRLDAVLDVGDGRRQRGDRAVDIRRRAVDAVQQGPRLAQRRLRRADGIDQSGLASHRSSYQVAGSGDVLVGEGQPLLGGFDVAGH